MSDQTRYAFIVLPYELKDIAIEKEIMYDSSTEHIWFKKADGSSKSKTLELENRIDGLEHGGSGDYYSRHIGEDFTLTEDIGDFAVINTGTDSWIKADAGNDIYADCIAYRTSGLDYRLVVSGLIPIASGVTDDEGDALVVGEYYYLSDKVAGALSKSETTGLAQAILKINRATDTGFEAIVQVSRPMEVASDDRSTIGKIYDLGSDMGDIVALCSQGSGWVKTNISNGLFCDGIGIKIEGTLYKVIVSGIVPIAEGILDDNNDEFIGDQYYCISNTKDGSFSKDQTDNICQIVFKVKVNNEGLKFAVIDISKPMKSDNSTTYEPKTITTNTYTSLDVSEAIYYCDCTNGDIIITGLDPNTTYIGQRIIFKKTDSSDNKVILVNVANGGFVTAEYNDNLEILNQNGFIEYINI